MKHPSASSGEDTELIRAFQKGNRSAFDRLVLKHKEKIFNLCYWFLQDYEEADDMAQEAFIKAFTSLKKFRFESAFSTWLYRIAVNTCKNRIKSSAYRHKKRTISLSNPGGNREMNRLMEIKDGSPSPVQKLEAKERRILIRKGMDALPSKNRVVLVLRDIQGLSYEKISQITGLNLGTVKSRLSRARLDLQSKMRSMH
ncbi:MAG: RNA polymerase sigma factor [Deltaproteobacteria bacterium]|nr:RNA polymerase sigma factor [Deltaproteobacteria bacterium]